MGGGFGGAQAAGVRGGSPQMEPVNEGRGRPGELGPGQGRAWKAPLR